MADEQEAESWEELEDSGVSSFASNLICATVTVLCRESYEILRDALGLVEGASCKRLC